MSFKLLPCYIKIWLWTCIVVAVVLVIVSVVIVIIPPCKLQILQGQILRASELPSSTFELVGLGCCTCVSWTHYPQQRLPICPLKWHVLNLATIIKKEREITTVCFIWNDISIATAIFSHCHQARANILLVAFYFLIIICILRKE